MSEVTGYLQKMQQKKLPTSVVTPKPSLIFLQPNNAWQWQGVSRYHMPTCCLQCPCEEFDKERLKSFYMKQSGFCGGGGCTAILGNSSNWAWHKVEQTVTFRKRQLFYDEILLFGMPLYWWVRGSIQKHWISVSVLWYGAFCRRHFKAWLSALP